MSITSNLFVHNTNTISIKKCKAGEDGEGQSQDSWDIIIKDKEKQEKMEKDNRKTLGTL